MCKVPHIGTSPHVPCAARKISGNCLLLQLEAARAGRITLKMELIKVGDDKRIVSIPVQSRKVSLKFIKKFFPEATGLTYLVGEDSVAVNMDDDDIININPEIKVYNVYYPTTVKSSLLSECKQKKIKEIMNIIQEDGPSAKKVCFDKQSKRKEKEPVDSSQKYNTPKYPKNKVAQLIFDSTSIPKKRTVFIGWKHKFFGTEKFIQQTNPIGGVKELELDVEKQYTFEEFKDIAVQCMRNPRNEFYFLNSDVEIGNFKNIVYKGFFDATGTPCDFWNFLPMIRASNHSVRIYLLTSERDSIQGKDKQQEPKKPDVQWNHPIPFSASTESVFEENNFPRDTRKNDTEKENNLQNVNKALYESIYSSESKLESTSQKPSCSFGNVSKIFQKSKIQFFSKNCSGRSKIQIVKRTKDPKSVESRSSNIIDTNKNSHESEDSHKDNNTPASVDISQTNPPEELNLTIPIIAIDEIESLFKPLGEGSYGTVYKALWRGTEVAVKKILCLIDQKSILREIGVMEKLRHPNIISIMAVALEDHYWYIVLEFFDGCNLRELFYDEKQRTACKLNLKKKNFIALQICKAITFLHASDVVHKDIKCENVLVNKNCIIKLCDFGLSRYKTMPSALNTTIGCNIKGTPLYMAPEIILQNMPGGMPSDVWSLACLIVEVYTEELVWSLPIQIIEIILEMKLILKKKKKPDLSKVPVFIRSGLDACFEFDPEKRAKANDLLNIYMKLDDVYFAYP